jgi:glycosyltransferase involved in cell wall biosynthesis
VLIVTDAFPPVAGGSGWSTYELARGLRARGDSVIVVRPRPGAAPGLHLAASHYDGFAVHELGAWAPPVPFVRNYFKNERLARSLARALVPLVREQRIDIVHGQHLLSAPGAIEAARSTGTPSVATIRDYWPVCYWSDLIHDPDAPGLCPACTSAMMGRCIRPHAGVFWPAAVPAIPYMRANLRWKRRALARADAIVAVSSTIGADLAARAPELASRRIEIIPNPVDLSVIEEAARSAPPDGLPRPYAIYVGKLAPNKGVSHLVAAAAAARLRWPLVVVGDGPERGAVEASARASGLDIRFTGWLDRANALRLLAHAGVLLFPSHGPESLSRVLLEAGALGVPAAAMDTGGTRDIVVTGETGLLSSDAGGLGRDLARLVESEQLRTTLGRAAQARVRGRFASTVVVDRMARLYDDLRRQAAGGRPRG